MSATESARLPVSSNDKIEVTCSCGKRYRVPAERAGSKIRCKNCRLKLEIPAREADISVRTRAAILGELGIKPEAEQQAKKRYSCSLCNAKLSDDEVKEGYGAAGLVCGICRASFGEDEAAPEAQASSPASSGETKKRKKGQPLQNWVTGLTPEQARNKGIQIGALAGVGAACFASSLLGLSWPVALVLAAAAGGAAGYQTYVGNLPRPEPVKKPA